MANRFLVSTTHHLLAVDTDTDEVWRIHSGAGLYFGLAVAENGLLYVACRNRIDGPQNEEARASEKGTILVLDRRFCVCDELRPPFPLRDAHGIECFDGRLWITCSYENMIVIYGLATGDWSRWYPAPDPLDRHHDIHHFNTIRVFRGQICLLAHRFGPSELLFFDYPSMRLDSIAQLGVMAHDLFLLDGEIATCSSAEGWIVNRRGRRLRTGNFPRGVATTSQGTLLGMSINSPRDQRQEQHGILRWYGPDWRFKADYLLPRVGMVLDVFDISHRDFLWDAVETWPYAEIARDGYNRVAPGNLYSANSFGTSTAAAGTLEWHGSEGTHRWTAARESSLSILINPGETRLTVEVRNENPNPYYGEIWLERKRLDTVVFDARGVQSRQYCIAPDIRGAASLVFRVPYLWKPADLLPGNNDERSVGLALHGVTVG